MAARSLALEALESRLNLSGVTPMFVPAAPLAVPSAVEQSVQNVPRITLAGEPVAGATNVPVSTYTAIYNSRLETRRSGTNIGWVSPAGAYVDYTLHANTAGDYSLALSLASVGGANLNVYVNGEWQAFVSDSATGSWDTYRTRTATINLNAGANTVRIQSANGTQYNLNAISFDALGAVPAVTPVSTINDNTWLSVKDFAAISGAQLETRAFGVNIGYMSASGATIDYEINVLTGGTYALTLGLANTANASLDVLVDGVKATSMTNAPTGSWDNFARASRNITLTAGRHTLRLASTGNTQFNLNSIHFARQSTITLPPPTSPPAPTNTSFNIAVNERWLTSYSALEITGTSSADSLYITQSGNTLTINANGATRQFTGNYGELIVRGGEGNDIITVDASVTLDTRMYGNGGANTLRNFTRGRGTIVSIGAGADNLTGNGVNTSYWADTTDTVNAAWAESNAGRVHRVASFYQPYSKVSGSYGFVSLELNGQNLVDPSHTGSGTTRLTNSSFWGRGPVIEDVNQGQAADCYFLTPLQSLARYQPETLRETGVDLGDGTYAIQFKRSGKTHFVRVDGDLPTNSWGGLRYSRPGASGSMWVSIYEKAYAHFRTGANSFASLDYGWMTGVYGELGVAASTFALSDQTTFHNTVSAKLAANKPVDIGTNSVVNGAPLATKHTYSVVNTRRDANGTVWVTLRNPWGFDGYGNDGNSSDGLLTMTFATLRNAVTSGTMVA